MKKTLVTVAAAAVAVTCLAWAQPPQGAKETVVIKEEASAAKKKPAETLDKPGSAPKPKVTRDPFVPGGVAAEAPPEDIKPAPKEDAKKPAPEAGNTAVVVPNAKPAPVVVAPEVEIKGILLSPKGNRAIVAGPSMTFIVKQGDKLGDYKVAQIDQKAVTFSFKDKKFAVKMPDQFAPPEAKKK